MKHPEKMPARVRRAAIEVEAWVRKDIVRRLRHGAKARYAITARTRQLEQLHALLGDWNALIGDVR